MSGGTDWPNRAVILSKESPRVDTEKRLWSTANVIASPHAKASSTIAPEEELNALQFLSYHCY